MSVTPDWFIHLHRLCLAQRRWTLRPLMWRLDRGWGLALTNAALLFDLIWETPLQLWRGEKKPRTSALGISMFTLKMKRCFVIHGWRMRDDSFYKCIKKQRAERSMTVPLMFLSGSLIRLADHVSLNLRRHLYQHTNKQKESEQEAGDGIFFLQVKAGSKKFADSKWGILKSKTSQRQKSPERRKR